ncbi:hypothetical protein ACM7HV_26210 [Pseudomonas paraeruginosa]|uniref:DoxX family protein n=1 Tax=Pseudomonas aeruginosa group TaxID=136841 RepID=UPI0002B77CD1|nr:MULTISPECIES: hypothetical protein [Pseudomonas aeruginosa group]KFF34203.1 hypothetical protein G039_0319510 [Pseudomonas aeruginosa VRFPA01]
MPSTVRTLLLAFVFAWFLLGGLGHFVFTDFFVGIVPPYISWPLAAVYASGVFELLGAFVLLLPGWRRMAACGLFLLTLCVTPANLHMWQHPESFPAFPPQALGARLLLQVFLLGCILALVLAPEGPASGQKKATVRGAVAGNARE